MPDLKNLRDELLDCVDRWSPEIHNARPRPTLRYGILQKCYRLLDRMLEICTVEAISLTGDLGEQACKSCCGGKPPSRMTLGERVQVLEKLDVELMKTLSERMPRRRARVLGKAGIQLLHSISTNRNLFTHDTSNLDVHQIAEALACGAEFCNLDLVTMIIDAQEARNRAPKSVG